MAKTVRFKVKRRRRREGKTDYEKRLGMLKSNKLRFVTRLSNKRVVCQVIEYIPEGDKLLINTTSLELKKHGWKGNNGNICAAYLTGILCGKKALEKNIKEGIFDIGINTPVKNSKVFAVLKGLVDAGVKIPHNEKILPSDDMVKGKTIEEYRKVKLDVNSIKEKILAKG